MKIIIYAIVLLALSSCEEKSPEVLEGNAVEKKNEVYVGKTEPIIVSDSLQPIVDSLVLYGVVEDEAIGYSGVKSNVYEFFKRLIEVSTDAELIELTDHNVPSMRSYAFWALAKKKNPMVKEIMMNHINDTAMFWMMGGCSLSERRVNNFFLDLLTPQRMDSDCLKLSREEIALIKVEIEDVNSSAQQK